VARTAEGGAQPSTTEILRAVRRVQLRTRRTVTDMVAGGYRSVFRGSGMEFEEVREYVPGDDVRAIDWNVTARTGRPYVKKFVEEREQTIFVALDVSASTRLGSGPRNVRQAAAELAAILAFSAAESGDKSGLLLFSDEVELELPPRTGTRQAFRITREALYRQPLRTGTSVSLACDHSGACSSGAPTCSSSAISSTRASSGRWASSRGGTTSSPCGSWTAATSRCPRWAWCPGATRRRAA
jgi:uncharacterized protein (DUF58 family)